MNKISIAIGVAALLISGCSDTKEQESKAPTTKEVAPAQTADKAANQDMYGVSSGAIAEKTTQTASKDVQVGTKHVVSVLETMNAANYTYAKVNEDGNVYWIAGPQTTVAVGDKISFIDQMVMEDFTSKSLGKTFEYLVFVTAIVSTDKATATVAAIPFKRRSGGKSSTRPIIDLRDVPSKISPPR